MSLTDTPFPTSAFRAYDIRGVIGQEITPEFMKQLGHAFVATFGATDVVVGYDARPSSQEFLPYFTQGVTEQGANVCLVGMMPSEVVIATAGLERIMHAAIITASHNPAEYVGVKLYTDYSVQIAQINYQDQLKEVMIAGNFPPVTTPGTIREFDPWPGYVNHITSLVPGITFSPRHILADAGNGMGGVLLEHLADHFNLEVDKRYFKPDGTYPNHVPNPIVPLYRKQAEANARMTKFDFSILFDGDGDRVIFLDENGGYINADAIGTLIADEVIQKKYPGSPVIIDMRRGWTTLDSGKERGYPVIATKSGNPYLKAAMREHGGAYGFEASAHNFYKDFFMSDSSGVTLAYVLWLLESTGKTLSELVAPYRHGHVMIDETNFIHPNGQAAIDALLTHYTNGQIHHEDGLNIDYPNWHLSLRSSNTEPLLRLNLEAREQTVLDQEFKTIVQIITSSGGQQTDH